MENILKRSYRISKLTQVFKRPFCSFSRWIWPQESRHIGDVIGFLNSHKKKICFFFILFIFMKMVFAKLFGGKIHKIYEILTKMPNLRFFWLFFAITNTVCLQYGQLVKIKTTKIQFRRLRFSKPEQSVKLFSRNSFGLFQIWGYFWYFMSCILLRL